MSTALQAALLVAAIAFTILIVCLIPIAFRARRQLEQLVATTEEFNGKIQILVEDGRELVKNVTELSKRVNQQLDDVSQVVRTARGWTERADRLVDEIGSVVEPPVHSIVRNANLLRTGIATFLQFLSHRNHHNQTTKESDHV